MEEMLGILDSELELEDGKPRKLHEIGYLVELKRD